MNMLTPPIRLAGQPVLPVESPLDMPVRGAGQCLRAATLREPTPADPGRRAAVIGFAALASWRLAGRWPRVSRMTDTRESMRC